MTPLISLCFGAVWTAGALMTAASVDRGLRMPGKRSLSALWITLGVALWPVTWAFAIHQGAKEKALLRQRVREVTARNRGFYGPDARE